MRDRKSLSTNPPNCFDEYSALGIALIEADFDRRIAVIGPGEIIRVP